ncbi:hypothetical protein, partial [Arthrobacter flavus]
PKPNQHPRPLPTALKHPAKTSDEKSRLVFGLVLSHITTGSVTRPPFDSSKLPAIGKTRSPHVFL